MKLVLEAGQSRPYAARHSRASYALHPLYPSCHRSDVWVRSDVRAVPKEIEWLPARYRFRYRSRQLGHARPRTTLVHYTHSLAEIRCADRGWLDPTQQLIACSRGVPLATFGSWASRAKVSVNDREGIIALALQGREDAAEASPPGFTSQPAIRLGSSIASLIPWIRDWLKGLDENRIAARHGVGVDRQRTTIAALRAVDSDFEMELLDATLRKNATGSPRGFQLRVLNAMARSFDEIIAKEPADFAAYIDLLKSPKQDLAALRIRSDTLPAATKVVRRVVGAADLVLHADSLDRGILRPARRKGSVRTAEFQLLNLLILGRCRL